MRGSVAAWMRVPGFLDRATLQTQPTNVLADADGLLAPGSERRWFHAAIQSRDFGDLCPVGRPYRNGMGMLRGSLGSLDFLGLLGLLG